MAKLTAKGRRRLKKSSFGLPGRRAYPMHDRAHAINAKGRARQMLNKGRGPSEAVEAKPAKDYEAKMGNSDEFIRRSAESLWAYLSPDA